MNINIVAPINTLSYGYTSLNFVRELMGRGHKVALWAIGNNIGVTNEPDAQVVRKALSNAQFFDSKAPCVRIWHQHDMAQFAGRGPHIGFPIFELNEFSPLEKHHLQSVDRLFVCSNWAKGVIENNGITTPTTVVPLGVDTSIFRTVPRFGVKPDAPTVFFNCGKWEVRKGHDILMRAFRRAFSDKDNVQLWMMCDNIFNNEQENAYWKDKYSDPQVRLIPRVESQQDVYNIMSQVDCGVFPARAEGWNLEALELMACGKHVIITDCSAHTEYCQSANADLVKLDGSELAVDGKWFHGQGTWGKIGEAQIDQIADYMVKFHEKRLNGRDITNYAGIDTANRFSWSNAARTMEESLNVQLVQTVVE